jgi:hypothetical protein
MWRAIKAMIDGSGDTDGAVIARTPRAATHREPGGTGQGTDDVKEER